MSEQQDEPEKRPRLNLTTSQVAASALAACCASIVASYLGVAGTVIGAAVGSVVATIGAAVYAHLFRRGGDRIKQTLLVNGQPVEVEVDSRDAARAAERAGRFYGADEAHGADAGHGVGANGAGAAPTERLLWTPAQERSPAEATEAAETAGTRIGPEAPTELVRANGAGPVDDAGRTDEAAPKPAGPIKAIRRYRKPIGVAAAIVAVFCVSITVGFLLGAPVRSAGENAGPPAGGTTTTTTTTIEQSQQSERQQQPSGTDSSGAASPSGSGSSGADGKPSPSGSGSASGSATPSATPSQAAGNTTAAAAGATNTASKTP
jgi:hypothetical protein